MAVPRKMPKMARMVMARLTALFMLLAAATLVAPAQAQDVVYPINSRIGLVPPPGFAPSTRFPGFENTQAGAIILLAELPAAAYEGLEKEFTDAALQSRGMTVEAREAVTLPKGSGFVIVGKTTAGAQQRRDIILVASLPGVTVLATAQVPEAARATLPDEALRAALQSVALRERIADAEMLAVLPYTFADLAGFRIVQAGPGGIAVLTDGPQDAVQAVEQSFVLLRAALGAPPAPPARARVARRLVGSAPGRKEVRILRAEPMRIGGQTGHEILAEAKDARTGVEVTAVQWLRFGPGGTVQMFGIARKDAWAAVFPRLRTLRDGMELR